MIETRNDRISNNVLLGMACHSRITDINIHKQNINKTKKLVWRTQVSSVERNM